MNLKPCPFCGSADIGVGAYHVECMDCLTAGPSADSNTEAIAAWNNRSDWNSVDSPPSVGMYLAHWKDDDGYSLIGCAFFNSAGDWCGEDQYYKTVTHWQQLPAPPGAE